MSAKKCPLHRGFLIENPFLKSVRQREVSAIERFHCVSFPEAMFTLYRIDFQSGSEIDSRQCEQCSVKSVSSIFALVWQKQLSLESKRVITSIRSKNGANPLNGLITLGAERSKKLSDTDRITFGIERYRS